MDHSEIQNKSAELERILSSYQDQLNRYQRELLESIQRYQKAIEQAKIRELEESLSRQP